MFLNNSERRFLFMKSKFNNGLKIGLLSALLVFGTVGFASASYDGDDYYGKKYGSNYKNYGKYSGKHYDKDDNYKEKIKRNNFYYTRKSFWKKWNGYNCD